MTIILILLAMLLLSIIIMIKCHYLHLNGDREGMDLFKKQLAIVGGIMLTSIMIAGFISLNYLNIVLFIYCVGFGIDLLLYFLVLLYDYLVWPY